MTDEELLDRAIRMDNFSGSILVEDKFDDWSLAKEVGKYLIRVDSTLLIGHLVLARACRHLGQLAQAADELDVCRTLVERGNLGGEVALLPTFDEEERNLQGV
jgi:hypothetical protein